MSAGTRITTMSTIAAPTRLHQPANGAVRGGGLGDRAVPAARRHLGGRAGAHAAAPSSTTASPRRRNRSPSAVAEISAIAASVICTESTPSCDQ